MLRLALAGDSVGQSDTGNLSAPTSFDGPDEFGRVDDQLAVRGLVGGLEEQFPHLLNDEVRMGLPTERKHARAIRNAPAQAALSIILIAAFPFHIFLGRGARRAGHEDPVALIPFWGTPAGMAGEARFALGDFFGIGGIIIAICL